jgi:hypothetical protein
MDKVDLIKSNVHSIINNKMKMKFDWFDLSEDVTLSNLCLNQAINLVIYPFIHLYSVD